jgi:hypothetical protein
LASGFGRSQFADDTVAALFVQLLLSGGANPLVKDNNGDTDRDHAKNFKFRKVISDLDSASGKKD